MRTVMRFNLRLRIVAAALAIFLVTLLVTISASTRRPSGQPGQRLETRERQAVPQGSKNNNRETDFFKGKEVLAGEVLVKFRQLPTAQSMAQVEREADADKVRKVGGTGARLIHSRSKDTATLVRDLSARGDVVYAEPNYVVHVDALPNDPQFAELWGLQNTGYSNGGGAGTAGADIDAVAAWELTTGSRDNVVAVVDTGIDDTHPDLAANMWSAGVMSLTLSPNPVVGPNTVTGTVTLTCAAQAGGFAVTLSTSNGAVARPKVSSITIPAGSTTATFTISTTDVSTTSYANITAAANGTSKIVRLTVN